MLIGPSPPCRGQSQDPFRGCVVGCLQAGSCIEVVSWLSSRRNPVLSGDSWRGVTAELLNNSLCTYGTFISLIFSFLSLEVFLFVNPEPKGTLSSTLPTVPDRVLNELQIYCGGSKVAVALQVITVSRQLWIAYVTTLRRFACTSCGTSGTTKEVTISGKLLPSLTYHGGSNGHR